MAHYLHDLDPRSDKIRDLVRSLPAAPGVCCFIDIVGSTEMKYHKPADLWALKLHNTFNFISLLSDFPDFVVKGIGDELMVFVPSEEMEGDSRYGSCLALGQELFSTLYNLKHYVDPDLFLSCKGSLHYCEDALNITFIEGVNDYYGKDIDIAARLTNEAREWEIVISEAFYELASSKASGPVSRDIVDKASERKTKSFKGVPFPIGFRVVPVD